MIIHMSQKIFTGRQKAIGAAKRVSIKPILNVFDDLALLLVSSNKLQRTGGSNSW